MQKGAPVLCRAYGDKPLRLVVVSHEANHLEVASEGNEAHSIGWPRGFTFQWDARLFQQLRATYERGEADATTLRSLWESAVLVR